MLYIIAGLVFPTTSSVLVFLIKRFTDADELFNRDLIYIFSVVLIGSAFCGTAIHLGNTL